MGYTMFTNKNFLRTSDGKIFPLCQCADSRTFDEHGRHPKSWTLVLRSDETHLLDDEEAFKRNKEEVINRHIGYYEKAGETADLDSYNYYGDTYNGNGRLRGMKTFYSTLHCKSANEFLSTHYLSIEISLYDRNYNILKSERIAVRNESDLKKADELFHEMKMESDGVCVGIRL